jgi:hypothetical protein
VRSSSAPHVEGLLGRDDGELFDLDADRRETTASLGAATRRTRHGTFLASACPSTGAVGRFCTNPTSLNCWAADCV